MYCKQNMLDVPNKSPYQTDIMLNPMIIDYSEQPLVSAY